jgi:hypothetical protein
MRCLVTITCLYLSSISPGFAGDRATKVDSVVGDWKVSELRLLGVKDSYQTQAVFKTGATWKIDKDGTGECGGYEVTWYYDEKSGKLNLFSTYTLFGIPYLRIKEGSVTKNGDDIEIGMGGVATIRLTPKEPASSKTDDQPQANKPSKQVATVEFEKGIIDKVVFTEPIETLKGLPKKLSVQREFQTTVSSVKSTGTELNGELKLGSSLVATVAVGFKSQIEESLGITLGKKDTVTEIYELDGKEFVKINVKWVERYRKGTATMADGTKVPFLVCVGLRTIPEKVD